MVRTTRGSRRSRGSTAAGYESYDRAHLGAVPPSLSEIELSADPVFRGDPQRCNPEQLLVLAAASCQLLSFLAVGTPANNLPPFALLDGVSLTGAPEPSTWAMMLVGFGGLGYAALRRRRKALAVA